MDETSPNLILPYLQAAQAQKHVTHNAALEALDLIVQLVLQSFAATTPPSAPDDGQVWAVGSGATGDWAGHDGALAAWSNGGWLFLTPRPGWRAALADEIRVWDGAAWVPPALADLQNLPGVGINASYDGTNKLAVASEAVLFTNTGNGVQFKVNKAAAGDTASLLFQTGWSGRAEIGTLGAEDFGIKVSADGSAWSTAFTVSAATGATTIAQLDLNTALAPASGGTGVANPAGATLVRSGAHALTLTTTAATALTLPVSGTLVTRSGTETLSNKTLTAPIINTAITGTAVTQSTTDQTAGRLLKTGDFGLGTTLSLTATDNLDALTATGFYFNPTAGNTPGNNYPIASAGALLNLRRSSTNWAQFFTTYSGVSSVLGELRYFVRSYGGAGWSSWSEVIHQGRILGTVSQSAGIPTGAVIERGSNANGEYVRFADGTQICTHGNAAITTTPAAFTGTITKIDGDKLWIGRWF